MAWISKLATLASLRYDRYTIKRFLERLEKKIMLSSDAFKVSWLYQEGLEEGRAEGQAKGKAEGVVKAIRIALQKKFPMLGAIAELDSVQGPEALDELLSAILEARSPEEARSALLAAVNQSVAS